ncbi:MAG TPA: hypothetical protein VFC18_09000, partial [Burkholderiales bacterium]|nr:hypothetical protein [Burkholderiales bacterium]
LPPLESVRALERVDQLLDGPEVGVLRGHEDETLVPPRRPPNRNPRGNGNDNETTFTAEMA